MAAEARRRRRRPRGRRPVAAPTAARTPTPGPAAAQVAEGTGDPVVVDVHGLEDVGLAVDRQPLERRARLGVDRAERPPRPVAASGGGQQLVDRPVHGLPARAPGERAGRGRPPRPPACRGASRSGIVRRRHLRQQGGVPAPAAEHVVVGDAPVGARTSSRWAWCSAWGTPSSSQREQVLDRPRPPAWAGGGARRSGPDVGEPAGVQLADGVGALGGHAPVGDGGVEGRRPRPSSRPPGSRPRRWRRGRRRRRRGGGGARGCGGRGGVGHAGSVRRRPCSRPAAAGDRAGKIAPQAPPAAPVASATMGINDDDVAAVRAASDIVAIISQATQLRKQGAQWVGRCPFHADNSPSFSVNANTNVFYCFGCGVQGDVINYVMEQRGARLPRGRRVPGGQGPHQPALHRPPRRARAASSASGSWRSWAGPSSGTTSGCSPAPTPARPAATCGAGASAATSCGSGSSAGRPTAGTRRAAP